MSDWEIIEDDNVLSKNKSQLMSNWEIINDPSLQKSKPKESIYESIGYALPRIGVDILKSGYESLQNIPSYYEKGKTEVPGLLNTIKQHPLRALSQLGAGATELGNDLLNVPKSLADYASNRLNLLPEEIAKNTWRPKESNLQSIEDYFGQPKYPGEELLRGTIRNLPSLVGGGKLAQIFNPNRLTIRSIVKDVLNTEKKQIAEHTNEYNKIWNKAEKTGFNQVPIEESELSKQLKLMQKYKTPKEYESLKTLVKEPTLENAQKAQSDMGIIKRVLEKKSRTSALTSEESKLHEAAESAEKYIENNMFKNQAGEINEALKNKYKKVTKSYKQNVVPYKYNKNIQAYKNEDILKDELVKALSKGSFAAKRGKYHRPIQARKLLLPAGGVLGGSYGLYNYFNKDNE